VGASWAKVKSTQLKTGLEPDRTRFQQDRIARWPSWIREERYVRSGLAEEKREITEEWTAVVM